MKISIRRASPLWRPVVVMSMTWLWPRALRIVASKRFSGVGGGGSDPPVR